MTLPTNPIFEDLASGAGKQTLIKTTLRNQIDLVSITDQKANMLLSINAIILSIVITLTGAKLAINLDEYLAETLITMPIILLMLTCLVSGILCIYAVTPYGMNKNPTDDIGIMMLTTKTHLHGKESFLKEMDRILQSNDLIYKNLSLDIFNLGSMLTRKYKLLKYAYYIFFIGMTITVFLFIIMMFL